MSDEKDKEAHAIRSLLDDYDASEALEWLSPLDDALEAAVAGVEVAQFASDSDSLTSGAASTTDLSTRPSAAAKRAKTRSNAAKQRAKQKDPNKARNERRLELIHLRRQASELESHLDELRRDDARRWSSLAIARGTQSPHASLRYTGGLFLSQRPVEIWEELAREQRTKRLRAETENTRLRLLVSSHVKTANQLRRILMPKRPRTARSDLTACIERQDQEKEEYERLPSGDASTDPADVTAVEATTTALASTRPEEPAMTSSQIFDMLKDSVVRARRDIDAVFIANGLAATEKTYRSAKVEQDDAHGMTMELAASKALPFDLESTGRVVWRHFNDLLPNMPDRTSFQYHDERQSVKINGVDDMLTESYGVELGNGFVSGKFDEWRVIRQFVERDRTIVIYCIVSEAREFASKPVSGIRILKRVYVVLRRPRGDSTRGTTLMQTYYSFRPVMYKTVPGLEHTLAAVTDFMFGFVGGRISLNYQMIERELQATAGS